MKSRVSSKPGTRVTDSWSGANHTTTTQTVTDFSEAFTVYVDVTTGPHKGPKPNQFASTRYRYLSGVTSTVYSNSGTRVAGPSVYAPQSFGSANYSAVAYNQALERAFGQIRGGVDLSVDIAEMGQVTRMLRAVGKLSSYIRSFHPRKWGDKWLEYQYGWKPLVQDIFGTADELRRTVPQLLHVVSTGHDRATLQRTNPSPLGYGTRVITDTCSYRCRFDLEFQIKPSVLQSLGNFGSLNPISLAWELTPYSFVVDWVIDIGGYLRNLETALLYGTMFKTGYYTEGYLVGTSDTISGSRTLSNPVGAESSSLTGSMTQTGKRRTVLTSMPFPRAPGFNAKLGWERILSAASLISQHISHR